MDILPRTEHPHPRLKCKVALSAGHTCCAVLMWVLVHHTSVGQCFTIENGCAGVNAALMVNNSELRALYTLYSRLDISWLHPVPYHTVLEKRSSFALLSVQLWRLLLDGCVLDPHATLTDVDRIAKHCCMPPPAVASRRKQVLTTPNYAGVWDVQLPDHSPYRVRQLLRNRFMLPVSALCPWLPCCLVQRSMSNRMCWPAGDSVSRVLQHSSTLRVCQIQHASWDCKKGEQAHCGPAAATAGRTPSKADANARG